MGYDITIPTSMYAIIKNNNGENRIRCSIYDTKNEAVEGAHRKIKELSNSSVVADKNMTFVDVCQIFLKHCDNRELYRETTQQAYEGFMRNHLQYFHGMKAIEIKKMHINQWRDEKSKTSSACLINHCLKFCKAPFNYCIDSKILFHNPFAKIKRLPEQKDEMIILTPRQITRLLRRYKTTYPKLYPIIYTAIYTGMRTGEILGLKRENVDLSQGKIKVVEQYTRRKFQEPKWGSKRVVDMPTSLVEVLKEHKTRKQRRSEYVFANEKGDKPICAIYKTFAWFDPLLKSLKFSRIKFHALRHTYTSIMLSRNVNIKYLQGQLGHKSIEITMNTYGHLIPDLHAFAVKVLDEAIKENEENKEEIKRKWLKRKLKLRSA